MHDVLAEPEVCENDSIAILAHQDVIRLEVPVDNPLVGPPIDIRPTKAVQLGEGAGDLGREGNDRLGGDRLLPPPGFRN